MDRYPKQKVELVRVARARALGLPDGASWDEIALYRWETFRIAAATARGLAPSASWETIFAHDTLLARGKIEADVFRLHSARGRGLPCYASWWTIRDYDHWKDLEAETAPAPQRTPIFFDIDPTTGKRR